MRRRVPEIPAPRLKTRKRQVSVFPPRALTPNRIPRAGSERLTVRSFFDSSLTTTSTAEGWYARDPEATETIAKHESLPAFARDVFSAVGYRRRLDESAREKATPSEKAHASSLFRPHVRRFISAFACAAVLDACFLCVVVGRAKKCLDFAATAYLVHFASCCAVAGVPKGAGWWVTTGVALSVTAILGEYLCVSRELRDIPVAGGR